MNFVPASRGGGGPRVFGRVAGTPAPPAAAETVRLWMPYPMSDGNQEITDIRVDGNFTRQGVYREGDFGNPILFAEGKNVPGKRTMTDAFRVVRKELVTRSLPEKELSYSREEFRKELAPAAVVPTDGPVEELAGRITAGKTTNREKARAIYDWIVDNMRRDPNTKGCGLGEVEGLLSSLGGKCADLHSVFVALGRAGGGVPPRRRGRRPDPPGGGGGTCGSPRRRRDRR